MKEFKVYLQPGDTFGRLTVIKELPYEIKGKCIVRKILCKCQCGNEKTIRLSDLRSGKTHSCGCLQKQFAASLSKTHGKSSSRLYHIWFDMNHRCFNEKNAEYKNYGGRGIKVCDEWRKQEGFLAFEKWSLANGYNENLTIDRIDNNKGYCPENCRWATRIEQQRNRSDNTTITYKGETKCIAEWSEITGLSFSCISWRLKNGWITEEILETPPKERRNKK
jgi:hypothetical protein